MASWMRTCQSLSYSLQNTHISIFSFSDHWTKHNARIEHFFSCVKPPQKMYKVQTRLLLNNFWPMSFFCLFSPTNESFSGHLINLGRTFSAQDRRQAKNNMGNFSSCNSFNFVHKRQLLTEQTDIQFGINRAVSFLWVACGWVTVVHLRSCGNIPWRTLTCQHRTCSGFSSSLSNCCRAVHSRQIRFLRKLQEEAKRPSELHIIHTECVRHDICLRDAMQQMEKTVAKEVVHTCAAVALCK